jgi:hypothetical protein
MLAMAIKDSWKPQGGREASSMLEPLSRIGGSLEEASGIEDA